MGLPLSADVLRSHAMSALDGVGDRTLGEWEEWTGRSYHIRRRLTAADQILVGPVVDIRADQSEVRRRLYPVRHLLPAGWAE